MKPVMQTTFGKKRGNCLQACIASILEIDIESIPWFGTRSDWFDKMNAWLSAEHDLVAIDIVADSVQPWTGCHLGYHIIAGPSPRGDFWHAVVGYRGEMVHDPHPSGDGLRKEKEITLFVARFSKETQHA